MRNNRLVGNFRWIIVSCFVFIGINKAYSQQVKLPTDTTFSENLRMVPDRDMYPGESFDLYFDITGFKPGQLYTALMHIDDVEIQMGYSTGSPMHVTVPPETVPGKYGIKVVAITGLPPQPKTVLTRDSLMYDPYKWQSVNGNQTGKLVFNGTGARDATLKPVNLLRGGYMQVNFHWSQPGTVSMTSPVLLQYSTNNGTSWQTAYTFNPKINYQDFVHVDLPKDAASDHTMVRFSQPKHNAGDSWEMDLVLETENGNVIMPNYYENIHFTVIGNDVTISPVASRKICSGEQFNLAFTTAGSYPADNIFIAQLSDKDGFFSNPIEVGTLKSTKSGTINVKLPDDMSPGIRYRIRILGKSGGKTITTSKPSVFLELGSTMNTQVTKDGNKLTAPEGTSFQWFKDNTLLPNETNRTITVNSSGEFTCEVTDANGCSFRTSPVPIQIQATAITDAENNYFKLFPNPTNDRVLLETNSPEISGEMEIRIINVYGQTMQKRLVQNSDGMDLELNLNAFENGMYYIIILNKDLTIVKPVLKK